MINAPLIDNVLIQIILLLVFTVLQEAVPRAADPEILLFMDDVKVVFVNIYKYYEKNCNDPNNTCSPFSGFGIGVQ